MHALAIVGIVALALVALGLLFLLGLGLAEWGKYLALRKLEDDGAVETRGYGKNRKYRPADPDRLNYVQADVSSHSRRIMELELVVAELNGRKGKK